MDRDRDRAALDGFFAELNRVWRMAGPPTYQDFEKLSLTVKGPGKAGGMCLARSTTQDILAGRREQPPKWRWVARFITVLQAAANQVGVDPYSLGTLTDWKQKHEAVCEAMAAAPELARAVADTDTPQQSHATDQGQLRARVTQQATGLLLNEKYAECDPELSALLRTVGRDWWHDYRDLVPDALGTYLSLEAAASLIRAYEPTLVPGWLQTEEYAAEAIRLSLLTPDQVAVARLVELRMQRRQFLERPKAAKLWVIVEEAAVRHRVGSARTMRAQIKHLMEVSQRHNITLQVIPLDTSVLAVAGGPVTFLRFPRRDLPDVVYLEQLAGSVYLPGGGSVSLYMQVLGRLGIEALKPPATIDFLHRILTET